MELAIYSPSLVNVVWVGTAFICGYLIRLTGLPAMIGFLAAGFILNFFGFTEGSLALDAIADMGITLLLFTIGLKLDLKSLTRPEIWAGTSIHVIFCILFFGGAVMAGSALGLSALAGLTLGQSLVLGFAFSFSSTVFAVKFLEDKGEMSALHGRTAIGILIMQDLFAVGFITFSSGKLPSVWALAIPVVLLAIRPLLYKVMDQVDHGEMLILAGFFIAVVTGATGFQLVGLKADLGALTLGVLMAQHPRASELSKSLYGFKDIFLVGFFLQIGLSAMPTMNQVGIALLLIVLLPVKSGLFFILFTRFKLRARTALLSTLTLSNYSIFGLLVVGIATKQGWLSVDWLIILSLALTFSFVLASPLNIAAQAIYDRYSSFLCRFETNTIHPDDILVDIGEASILIFGMGRIGTGAYDLATEQSGKIAMGLDANESKVAQHQKLGRNVHMGDSTDFDFWSRADLARVDTIMLATTNLNANIMAIKEIKKSKFSGKISAVAVFDEDITALKKAGATSAYNIFADAGSGFAMHTCESMLARPVGN